MLLVSCEETTTTTTSSNRSVITVSVDMDGESMMEETSVPAVPRQLYGGVFLDRSCATP